jgi:bacterioferritin
MRGDPKVIKQLNSALLDELTAIVQYMVQAELCDNWGYKRLAALTKKRAIQEMHHAEGLIERIIFLDGTPNIEVGLHPRVGADVKGHLEIDLRDELDAVKKYNSAVEVCRDSGDNGSRELFEGMIKDEEGHVLFLESQLQAIKDLSIGKYLSEQLKQEE